MEYSGTSTTTWDESSFDVLEMPPTSDSFGGSYRNADWNVSARLRERRRSRDWRTVASGVTARASAPTFPNAGALPGELLTEAVASNLEDRRLLLSVFSKFAAEGSIGPATLGALQGFLDALPRPKQLPIVSPDGEGGLTLAWAVPGQGRSLVTVLANTLYAVRSAGTPHAQYLPEIDFEGTLPDDVLALIPE